MDLRLDRRRRWWRRHCRRFSTCVSEPQQRSETLNILRIFSVCGVYFFYNNNIKTCGQMAVWWGRCRFLLLLFYIFIFTHSPELNSRIRRTLDNCFSILFLNNFNEHYNYRIPPCISCANWMHRSHFSPSKIFSVGVV